MVKDPFSLKKAVRIFRHLPAVVLKVFSNSKEENSFPLRQSSVIYMEINTQPLQRFRCHDGGASVNPSVHKDIVHRYNENKQSTRKREKSSLVSPLSCRNG